MTVSSTGSSCGAVTCGAGSLAGDLTCLAGATEEGGSIDKVSAGVRAEVSTG